MSVEIPMGHGQVLICDDSDAEFVLSRSWYLKSRRRSDGTLIFRPYAMARNQKGRLTTVTLHRLLLGAAPGEIIDHINGNPMDNRRENLRSCTAAQNTQNRTAPSRNRSGYRGIYPCGKTYVAEVQAFGRKVTRRGFRSAVDAAKAYDGLARKYHGVFARLNFPDLDSGVPLLTAAAD